MIRQAPRILRSSQNTLRTTPIRRLVSTAPPARKRRSFKSLGIRLGLVIGAIGYYNNSELFAEEPHFSVPPPQEPTEETSLPTLESLSEQKRQRGIPPRTPTPETQSPPPFSPTHTDPDESTYPLAVTESEASQEGAYNEETGEINWDCPCLGGMAHGPCGPEFREAFSCFVFSKEEPKGMDCIDRFKGMQDCFRRHPDVYGEELADDEDGKGEGEGEVQVEGSPAAPPLGEDGLPVAARSATSVQRTPAGDGTTARDSTADEIAKEKMVTDRVVRQHGEEASESKDLVPKAAHDSRSAIAN